MSRSPLKQDILEQKCPHAHTHTYTPEHKQMLIQLVSSVTQQSCDWLETDCIAEKQLYSAIVILSCASPVLPSEYYFSQSLRLCVSYSLFSTSFSSFCILTLSLSHLRLTLQHIHMWLSNERPDWWNVTSSSLTDTDTGQHLVSSNGPLDGLWPEVH